MNKTIRQYEDDIARLKLAIDTDQKSRQNYQAAMHTIRQETTNNIAELTKLKKEKAVMTADLDTKIKNLMKQNRMIGRELLRYKRMIHDIDRNYGTYTMRIKYRQKKIEELKNVILQQVEQEVKKKEEQKQELSSPPKYLNGLAGLEVREECQDNNA